MSKVQIDLINISRLLASFSDNVRNDNAMGNFFINSIAEDIVQPILSILFDCENLENMNYISERNYPAIDLGDKKKRISFQITSDNSLDKIKNTIEKFIYSKEKLYEYYDELYFYIIKDNKQNSYNDRKIKEILSNEILKGSNFYFDVNFHILDNSDIAKLIKERLFKTPEKIKQIYNLLEQHYGDISSKIVSVIQINNLIILPPNIRKIRTDKNGFLQYFEAFKDRTAEQSYLEGLKELDIKNYNKSRNYFDKSLDSLNKNIAQVINDKAISYIYENENNIDIAITEFEKAISINPKHSIIVRNLGFSYYKIKNYDKAISNLKTSLKIQDNDLAKEMLLMAYYEKAIILKDEGKLLDSLIIFEEMNKIFPNDENTLVNIGALNALLENFDEAEKSFKKVLDLNQNNIQAKFNLASLYSRKRDLYNSIKLYKEILEVNPTFKELNYNIGLTYDKLDDYDNAIKYLKTEIELYPNSYLSFIDLANVYLKKEEYENAINLAKKSLEINNSYYRSIELLEKIYLKANKNYELLSHIISSIKFNTNYRINKIKYLESNPNLKESKTDNFILAQAYYLEKNYNKSILFYKRCIELEISNNSTYLSLFYYFSASCYSILNNINFSLENLEKSISLDKKHIEMAKNDKDFENIKNHPDFIKLLSM